MDAELEFAIQPNTTGKQLFDQVRNHATRGVKRMLQCSERLHRRKMPTLAIALYTFIDSHFHTLSKLAFSLDLLTPTFIHVKH